MRWAGPRTPPRDRGGNLPFLPPLITTSLLRSPLGISQVLLVFGSEGGEDLEGPGPDYLLPLPASAATRLPRQSVTPQHLASPVWRSHSPPDIPPAALKSCRGLCREWIASVRPSSLSPCLSCSLCFAITDMTHASPGMSHSSRLNPEPMTAVTLSQARIWPPPETA